MSTRRPRKTAKQWERLIEQHGASELTIAQFCQQHDVALSTFSKWHRKFKTDSAPTKNAFKQVKTSKPIVAEASASQTSTVSLQLGPKIVLTIRSGDQML